MKSILSDAGDLIFKGSAYTKKGFYDFVKEKTLLDQEEIYSIYKKYRDLAYTHLNYSYWQACKDSLNHLGLDDKFEEFKNHINNVKGITILPGVKNTIPILMKKGIGFYIVSDSVFPGKHIKDLIEKEEIFITDAISSKDVGAMKPSKEFFNTVLQRYNLKKEETYFLGHSYDELKGANDLGFKVIACFYDPRDDLSFIPEKYKLNKFEDLSRLQF